MGFLVLEIYTWRIVGSPKKKERDADTNQENKNENNDGRYGTTSLTKNKEELFENHRFENEEKEFEFF